ncbi:MAG: (2Fe-2S)-binding protein [Halobacteriovoraceae bacterium]|nr:(2Fe-2S)-binding protein [Halobacteriovoraceae bacterium]MCB9094045.1 (2Fe-2S)-binding protein [Halobacteriovoraceae bacterium]
MYICVCNAISDTDLEKLKNQYPHLSWTELANKIGLGSDCGSCLQNHLEMLDNNPPTAAKNLASKKLARNFPKK